MVACLSALLAGSAFAAPVTVAKPTPPAEPAPDFPSGYEPDLLRSRLASPDSSDVARACGNLRVPWGYRGWIGREQAMRSYGRRGADGAWTRAALSALLDSAIVDTIYRAPSLVASCKPAEAPPIYLWRVHRGNQATSVLLRFDLGVALVFADEAPLGMIVLGARADTLWARLGEVLADDPILRRERPATGALLAQSRAVGEAGDVDAPPVLVGRGRDMPEIPEAALKKGIFGTVHVLVRVDARGEVEDAFVHAGPDELRDVALETAWGMRFKPARKDGKPVAAWTIVSVTFH